LPRKYDRNANSSLKKLITALPAAEYAMNLCVIYQDAQSRYWAGEVYHKVRTLLGAKSLRCTWWNLADLIEPGVLAGAVSGAMRSDMTLVAVSNSEGLPLPFYYWVNAWLPHRLSGQGALVGLLGVPSPRSTESGRLRKYLRTVARRARMDLLLAECFTTASTPEQKKQIEISLEPNEL
jgi:hypothetical protein